MAEDLHDRKLVSVALDHVEIDALLTGLVLTNAALMNRGVSGHPAVKRCRDLTAKLEHAQRVLAGA